MKKNVAVIGAGVLGVNTAINMLEWKQVILMAHK